MTVEAAVGEPRFAHEIRDADAVEPALPKEPGADVENPLAVAAACSLLTFMSFLRRDQKTLDSLHDDRHIMQS